MKKLSPAIIAPTLLGRLLALSPVDRSKAWDRNLKDAKLFKEDIDIHLKVEQSERCAYCGSRFMSTAWHRDHIAPKGRRYYPEWTFEPLNLVLACYDCNSGWKNQQDTIATRAVDYQNCTFTIVHPYFDDPKNHLAYTGHRLSILISSVNGSTKGDTTIKMFDLASPNRTKQRMKDAILDKDLDYLHGKWRHLAEAVVLAPVPQRLISKLRG
ncbi:MAG: retron system putative HNH endonuclease [Gluconobacter japonicus]|uniref:retron system putative HNH endonuclease n=1 Tax=Gluconobacter japonicus TaxID=376620 RepID=UPI0039E922FA